jgi:hypothetical protein
MLQLPRVRSLIYFCLPIFVIITDHLFSFGPYSLGALPLLAISICLDPIYFLQSLSPLVYYSIRVDPYSLEYIRTLVFPSLPSA